MQRLAEQHGVEVTGRVDDVRPHIAAGSVYVVPLRIGGGTRLKIFEAMAMGKAVVSTTIGAEGLPVTDGADIVIADEPAAFAAAVVRLIRDDAARARASRRAARRLVVEHYDWSAVAQDFEDALARVARAGHAPVPGEPRRQRGGRPFLRREHLTMNVSVFGLGYVGSVSAASFAADGHTVVGVDVNPDKVASLNDGRSPIVEKGLDELIRDNAAQRPAARDDRARRRRSPRPTCR